MSSGKTEKLLRSKYVFGYQGQFAEQDEETGYDQFEARLYDNRLGRWMAPDPAGQYWSPYLGMGNNWVNGVDPDGELFGGIRSFFYALFNDGTSTKINGDHVFIRSDGITKNFGGSGLSFIKGSEVENNRHYESYFGGKALYERIEDRWISDFSIQVFSDPSYIDRLDFTLGNVESFGNDMFIVKGIDFSRAIDLRAIEPMTGTPPLLGGIANAPATLRGGFKLVRTIGDKFARYEKVVPAKIGGQSQAVYVKIKNAYNKTVKMYKDTYGKNGEFIHRKYKFPTTHQAN